MAALDGKLTRIGIFYDGNFFFHVSNYYHYHHERRARISIGGLLTALAAVAVALACNPAVLGQYWHTFTHRPPAQYHSPTLGTLLQGKKAD